MAKDYLKKLRELEGAVIDDYNPYNHILQTPSPSVNFTFGRTHGLPLGFSMALGGPPKGGKSLICNAIIGKMHQDDPDAIAIKFDSEFRETGQMTKVEAAMWGIDLSRYLTYSVSDPVLIFDRIEKEIASQCADGMPLKLLVIDSLTAIQGRRAMNADTIATQQIGDDAKTIGDGLKRILPVQKKYRYAQINTCHIRAELDPLEQMRGNKVKMTLPWAAMHMCEYFMYIEPNKTAAARKDVNGNDFTDETKGDIFDNAEVTAHKIRVKMKDNSVAPKGRSGEFTLSYTKGIINQYEEIYLLGKNRGIICHNGGKTYTFKDKQWVGAASVIAAIKDDTELQKAILQELKLQDMAGKFLEVEDNT